MEKTMIYMIVRNIAPDIPKEAPREPSTSRLDSPTYSNRSLLFVLVSFQRSLGSPSTVAPLLVIEGSYPANVASSKHQKICLQLHIQKSSLAMCLPLAALEI